MTPGTDGGSVVRITFANDAAGVRQAISMSLSQKATASDAPLERDRRVDLTFLLVLVCIVVALILASAFFSPVTLDAPGADVFLVGP
jgi:hypothetical protein